MKTSEYPNSQNPELLSPHDMIIIQGPPCKVGDLRGPERYSYIKRFSINLVLLHVLSRFSIYYTMRRFKNIATFLEITASPYKVNLQPQKHERYIVEAAPKS